ncbi:glycoside hydrolase family 9 protein [Flavitalea sp.]|nr:glycoside hydrolase family 9 protein [Flavitalea sp.]
MIKRLSFFLFAILSGQVYGQERPELALNQTGYYPNAPKIVVLITDHAVSGFDIINAKTKDIVFSGKPSGLKQSNNSSLKTQVADFSSISTPGKYIYSDGREGISHEFYIAPKVQSNLAVASLKAFYFQRVSMPLTAEYAGQWTRPAGHPDTKVVIHPSAINKQGRSDSIISSSGGWYDAGDYNKYIVNSGITMGTLLSAYEDFPFYFDTLRVGIPGNGNRLPDLLDEVLYNLRWMMTMQDPDDGGVYHKCTNAAFDGTVMPGVTKLTRYVVQKSTAATLDFTAVMAQAGRIFKKFDKQFPGLSDSCVKAAKKSWNWSLKNPSLLYNQDSMNLLYLPKVTTGAYGDRMLEDEWFWASTELYLTTGEAEYESKMKTGLEAGYSLPTWARVHLLGIYSILRLDKNTDRVNAAKMKLLKLTDEYLSTIPSNAFLTVMGSRKSDFNWGSNSNAANQGILMINAWKLTGDIKYANAALTNLDYICGRNATGYHFVTGFGKRSPKHPHHRPSEADAVAEPIPGLLVGGPNPGMQDKCNYPFKEPETAYVDDYCSYASNEIAINWNAPLVYLANAIEAIQYKTGYSKLPQKK